MGFNYEGKAENEKLINIARESYDNQREIITKSLSNYIEENGALNGTKMRNDWFPELQCDIFISHAHNDEKKLLLWLGGF